MWPFRAQSRHSLPRPKTEAGHCWLPLPIAALTSQFLAYRAPCPVTPRQIRTHLHCSIHTSYHTHLQRFPEPARRSSWRSLPSSINAPVPERMLACEEQNQLIHRWRRVVKEPWGRAAGRLQLVCGVPRCSSWLCSCSFSPEDPKRRVLCFQGPSTAE